MARSSNLGTLALVAIAAYLWWKYQGGTAPAPASSGTASTAPPSNVTGQPAATTPVDGVPLPSSGVILGNYSPVQLLPGFVGLGPDGGSVVKIPPIHVNDNMWANGTPVLFDAQGNIVAVGDSGYMTQAQQQQFNADSARWPDIAQPLHSRGDPSGGGSNPFGGGGMPFFDSSAGGGGGDLGGGDFGSRFNIQPLRA